MQRLYFLGIVGAGLVVGCATGSGFGEDGGFGEGAGTTANPGGGGSAPTTATDTFTTMMTTTTTGEMCAEAPCKLTEPQCGCAATEMCAINTSGERECHEPGEAQLGATCTGIFGCDKGLLCVNASSSVSVCSKYCSDDNECGGGLCLLTLTDPNNPNGTLPGVTLCTDSCVPSTNAGCNAAGLGCQIYLQQGPPDVYFTLCSGAGSSGQGSLCTDNTDCAPTFACLDDGTGNKCLKYCNVAAPNCPLTTTCYAFQTPVIVAGVEYGACL